MGYTIKTIDCNVTIPAKHIADTELFVLYAHEHGFEGAHVLDDGSVALGWMNGKSSTEDELLDEIAPRVPDGSYIVWQGEDDEMWADVFMDGERFNLNVTIRVELGNIDTFTDPGTMRKLEAWADDHGIRP